MRLLIVLPSHARGGVENYALLIAKASLRRGWEAHVVLSQIPALQALAVDFAQVGATVHSLDLVDEEAEKKRLTQHFLRWCRMVALLRRVKPDVVQINVPWLGKGLASIVACGGLRLPTQVVYHLAPQAVRFGSLSRRLVVWAKNRGQQWVAVSGHNRKVVESSFGVDDNSVRVIYNGIRVPEAWDAVVERNAARARILGELGLSARYQLLLTVGRLSHQKGYIDLIDVVDRLRHRYPDARFLWVGEGALRPKLESLLKERGLGTIVRLLGQRHDIPALLSASDLFVFPSHFEGFPFALLEAMAYKLPFVTTNACGVEEMVRHNLHGILCEAKDREGLCAAIAWALDHPREMHEMAEHSFIRVQEYSEDRMLGDILENLEKLRAKEGHG